MESASIWSRHYACGLNISRVSKQVGSDPAQWAHEQPHPLLEHMSLWSHRNQLWFHGISTTHLDQDILDAALLDIWQGLSSTENSIKTSVENANISSILSKPILTQRLTRKKRLSYRYNMLAISVTKCYNPKYNVLCLIILWISACIILACGYFSGLVDIIE